MGMSDSSSVRLVQQELESLGYKTEVFDSGTTAGIVVAFDYSIEVGSNKGKQVWVGVSFQEEGYPDYPPHWIHITPPIPDGREGAVQNYERNNQKWLAMSRPPGKLWDQMPTKYMGSYIKEHLRKIWRNV